MGCGIATICNELIDISAWTTPPPWIADWWAGLAGVLDLARIEAATESDIVAIAQRDLALLSTNAGVCC